MTMFVGKMPSPDDILCQWCRKNKVGKQYYQVTVKQCRRDKKLKWAFHYRGDTVVYGWVCGKCLKAAIKKEGVG